MTPLISVVIPCYNHGAYIDETIQSVLAQTVQDFEILVLDDGSTDAHTIDLLRSAPWPRAQVFRTDNGGLARARNTLNQRSTGRYLCALDADDRLHPQYFEKTLAAFDADPGLTFVSTRLQMFGEQSLVLPDSLRCDLPTLLTDCPIFSAALLRREAIFAVGGYDETMTEGNEDWDFWITLLERGYRGIILPDVLFYYRRRRGSMCDTCTTGETHLRLVEYLTRKHESSFHAHLDEALLSKDGDLQKRVRANWLVQQEIDEYLRPAIARRQAELTKLRAMLDGAARRSQPSSKDDVGSLRAEYDRAIKEIADLRDSTSWKITAPLRAVHDALRALRGRKP
jgi:glycosyltransferase involved in cell wall biosynthesis